MVDETKVRKGKSSRAQGNAFEVRVREDLEEKGWIVAKWQNNVEFEKDTRCWCGADSTYNCADCRAPICDSHSEYKGDCDEDHYIACTDCNPERANLKIGKLVKAKAKWAGPNRPMMMGAGFPDFIAFDNVTTMDNELLVGVSAYKGLSEEDSEVNLKVVIGVESKLDGELDRVEKEKCKWLLDNNIFSKILIAEKTKVKNKVVIVYHDFKEKYWRFYGSKD